MFSNFGGLKLAVKPPMFVIFVFFLPVAVYIQRISRKPKFCLIKLLDDRGPVNIISDKHLQDMGPSLRRKNVTWDPNIKTYHVEEMSSNVTKLHKLLDG